MEGECLPTPQCSQNIIHATSVVKDLDDDGNACHAGEPVESLCLFRIPTRFAWFCNILKHLQENQVNSG